MFARNKLLWSLLCFALLLFGSIAACSPLTLPVAEPGELSLQGFSATLAGKGNHGTVVCARYQGRRADLQGVSLLATVSRAGEIIEEGISAEILDGESCFELTDAKYVSVSSNSEGGSLVISAEPLSLRIEAYFSDGRQPFNGSQDLLLGPYLQFPFLSWIFPAAVRPACVAGGHTREGIFYPAWDIIPEPSQNYPTLIGTPVLAPVDGTAYVWLLPNEDPAQRFDTVNAVIIYSDDTGFAVDLTHEADVYFDGSQWQMLKTLNGQQVSAGTQIGVIGPKDHASSIPHTHLQVFIPPQAPTGKPDDNKALYTASTKSSTANVDAIKQNLFLDANLNSDLLALSGQSLRCAEYPWGELLIPQQLSMRIDGQSGDWAGIELGLRDKEGDSLAGEAMDLRALYSAVDGHYLYLLIEAGQQPEGIWAMDIFIDLNAKNACGSSERSIKVWSDVQGAFTVGSVDNCPDSSPETYPALFAWEDAFELRLPLVYLGNPAAPKVIAVKGILIGTEGEISYPDYMR